MDNEISRAFPDGGTLRIETLKAGAARARLYVVFITPRSGSTWLTELAMNSGSLGCPQEWFNEGWISSNHSALGCRPPRLRGTLEINRYVDAIIDEGQGTAGLELSITQSLALGDLLDGPFDPRWLTRCFFLRRRNLIEQAVSLYRSATSNRYHSYQNSSPQEQAAFEQAQYDESRILQMLHYLIDCEMQFQRLFDRCGLQPMPLFYEDLQASPLATLRWMAHQIGSPPPDTLPSTTLSIMRDTKSAGWCDLLVSRLPTDVRRQLQGRLVEGRLLHDLDRA